MCSLYILLQNALSLYYWVLIIAAILSWLLMFGVINRYNRVVATMDDLFYRVTQPALRPIRQVVPPLGGVDISFVILVLLIIFVQNLLAEYVGYAACH